MHKTLTNAKNATVWRQRVAIFMAGFKLHQGDAIVRSMGAIKGPEDAPEMLVLCSRWPSLTYI